MTDTELNPSYYSMGLSCAGRCECHRLRLGVKIAKWKRKFVKLQKYLKQWQGAWREHSLFDDPSKVNQLPLKFSKHRFRNGLRCLMKLRYNQCEYISPSLYPKSDLKLLEDKSLFNSLGKICFNKPPQRNYHFKGLDHTLEVDCKEIAHAIYMNTKKSVDIMMPVNCEIYTCLCAKKGMILLCFSESKKDCYIKFIFSKAKQKKIDSRLMFNFKYKSEMKLVKRWRVSNIKAIYRKSIVEKKSSIEIFYFNGKSVLFNFDDEKARDDFYILMIQFAENALKINCISLPGGRWRV